MAWLKRVLLGGLILLPGGALPLMSSCGGGTAAQPDGGFVHPEASVFDRRGLDGPYHPEASCLVTIDSPPLMCDDINVGCVHVDFDADVQYNSNPPSSGPHYPIWAAYQEYQTPVDRRYYVHDLEHGAVVFLYTCPDSGVMDDGGADGGDAGPLTGCAAIVDGLRKASASIPDDPLCDPDANGVRVRTVITPDPLIPTPVAATAWGWTYTAACIDLPTLSQFANDHYGKGPEVLCANGTTSF